MLNNHIKTALRSLNRNRLSTVINILGLAISLACCIVFYVLIRYEYSFDKSVPDGERIFRVVTHTNTSDQLNYKGAVCFPMSEALRNEATAIELAANIFMDQTAVIKLIDKAGNSKLFDERSMAYAENDLLQIFNLPVLFGNPQRLLQQPDEVVLTHSLAKKFYGNTSLAQVIGDIITINQSDYQISGIIEDIPANSNIYFTMLLPFKVVEQENPTWSNNWNFTPGHANTFIKLKKEGAEKQLESQLATFPQKYLKEDFADSRSFHLQPLANIHTDTKYGGTLYAAPKSLLLVLITIGAVILITACVNFINLATAQAANRAKEVGIRKTMGSSKWQIIWQFMLETGITVLLATLIGVGIAELFLVQIRDYFLNFSDFMVFNFSPDFTLFFFLLAVFLVITLGAGLYPARFMAAYPPAIALKQSLSDKRTSLASSISLRKALIIAQITISQVLIICTLIIIVQLSFFQQSDLGFEKEQVLNINMNLDMPVDDLSKIEVFRHELMSQNSVSEVSFYSNPPTSIGNNIVGFDKPSNEGKKRFSIIKKSVDASYLDLFEIQLLAGRKLEPFDHHADSVHQYNILVNETTIKMLGYESPEAALGEVIALQYDDATIVGVVADFANSSLKKETQACYLHYGDNIYFAGIKLEGRNAKEALAAIHQIWQDLYPDHVYRAKFLDEYMAIIYTLEDLLYKVASFGSILAIFIGCIGLYGLVDYLSFYRRKEIGIRKTFGASVQQIVRIFMKEFTWLVIVGFILSAPLAYFVMQKWLSSFAYQVEIEVWYFAAALILSITIALFTVGYKSVKAALVNPHDILRE
ncbi:ABC transporter permease [Porifericola rhodea]|uniref:ABC transporter permease n=1 Tax=Porifericola rhodea TaxID=930972 RepID=UPI0026664F5F|nr:ABC transporter permease [Porifericola rhodea]WKN32147.1 ABC transporter permease [Porifericola rhodea]